MILPNLEDFTSMAFLEEMISQILHLHSFIWIWLHLGPYPVNQGAWDGLNTKNKTQHLQLEQQNLRTNPVNTF